MKRVIKNAVLLSVIFTFLFLFTDTAHAALCRDLDYNECIGATDDSGVSCTNIYISGGIKCAPSSCSAYNNTQFYGYTLNPHSLTDCVADSRCTFLNDSCVPKTPRGRGGKYTCEDYGKTFNAFGGDVTCYDQLGGECEINSDGWCVTVQTDDDYKVCADYTSKTECDAHEKDDGGNACLWDDEENECDEIYSQDAVNDAATQATKNGEDFTQAVQNKQNEQLSGIKKTCALYSVKDCPKKDEYGVECVVAGALGGNKCHRVNVVKSNAKYKCSDVKYLTTAWLIIRIAMPFIIILFGSLDFIKAVMASDEKKMKESRGKFVKRMIAFFLAIFVPFVVQFIFQAMGTYGSQNMCLVSCIVTNDTSDKGCD